MYIWTMKVRFYVYESLESIWVEMLVEVEEVWSFFC